MAIVDYGDVPAWLATLVATGALVAAHRAYRRQDERVDLQDRLLQEQQDANWRILQDQQEATRQLVNQIEDLNSQAQELRHELLRALNLQVKELEAARSERDRHARLRHREQATQVYVWRERRRLENPPAWRVTCHVRNSSRQAVYAVSIRWYNGTTLWGEAPPTLDQLLPGDEHQWHREWNGPGDVEAIGAVVEFRDAAGEHWLRHPGGELMPR